MVSVIRRTLLVLALVAATTTAVVATDSAEAGATSTTYYAAVGGSGDCSVGNPCSLTTALSDVAPGDVVDLTTPGNASDSSTFYSGGFSVDTLSTSALEPVTIQPALGVADPILDGGDSQTVFNIGSGVYFDLSGVTIQDGTGSDGGGIANTSGGTVTVTDSTFSANSATYGGGAIDNAHSSSGALTVTDSTFSGNSAGDDGGAIDNGDIGGSGTVTVSDSTFSANSATYGGGAIDNADNDGSGTVTVSDSTFSANSAGDGGAIDNGDGGGDGTLTVTSSTFSGNTAGADGPTIDEGDNAGSGATTVAGDLFAGSCDQASGSWTDNGDSVGSDTSCENGGANDQVTSNLSSLLGPLADNGGPTQTMVPLGGNPAVGLIVDPTANLCPTTDQRGEASGPGAACDAGAVQLDSQTITFTSTAPTGAEVGGTYTPTANGGGSGNPVNFSIDGSSTSGCTYDSGTGVVTFSAPAGTCVIDANQTGNSTYAPASQVTQSVTVSLESQTITFTSSAPSGVEVGGTYTPTANGGGSDSPVNFSIDGSSTSGCTYDSGTGVVTFSAPAGTCVIDANQTGDDTHQAAPQAQQTVDVGLLPQSITFTSSAPSGAEVGGTYTPAATGGGSDNPVNFSIDGSSTSGCTYDSGTGVVTFSATAGTCVIDANQTGNSTYAPASQVTQSVTVSLDGQTISFASSAGSPVVGATYTPAATGGGSGNPVNFSIDGSSTSGCTYDSGTGVVTYSAPAGTCVIDANQAGDSTYAPASQVTQSVTVSLDSQTISFTSSAPTGATVGGTYTPTAHATSKLTVTISVAASSNSVCSISGATVTFNGAGTCIIDANQVGDSTYAPASQVTQSVTVSLNSQSITFTSSAGSPEVGGTYTPAATGGGSDNPVNFSIDGSSTSGCTFDVGTGVVTFSAPAGTCIIDANQAGNDAYQAAPQAQQTVDVGVLPQTISFTTSAPTGATVNGTYTPSAQATSNLAVTISVAASSASVCSISGATVTFNGAGTCIIDANQSGSSTYAPASQMTQSIDVSLNTQTITFTSSAPSGPEVGGTYTPAATGGGSGNPVNFSIDGSSTSGCTYDAGTGVATFSAPAGTCVLDANQAGDDAYQAAPQAQQTVGVGVLPQTISFTSSAPTGATVNGTYTPSAQATSSLTVAITVAAPSTSVCSLSEGTVTFNGAGTCVLDANQAGDSTYASASQVTQSIAVSLDSQTITFTSSAPTGAVVGGTYTPTAHATSKLTVTITVAASSASVCSLSGHNVTFKAAGTCVLDANQAGNTTVAPAHQVTQSLTVGRTPDGYWLVGSDGGIFSFGTAHFYGSMGATSLNRPIVGITPTADHHGYWLVGSDGGVFAFGDAGFVGSLPGLGLSPAGSGLPRALSAPIVSIVPAVGGHGYFMVGSDGGIFALGDATFAGSCLTLAHGCDAPAVAVVPDASGRGYWLVTTVGSVYAFGNARAFGGLGGSDPSPVTAMARSATGDGYLILQADGSVTSFGDAPHFGTMPVGYAQWLHDPASAVVPTASGGGFWVMKADGAVFGYGDATYLGGMNNAHLNGAIIAAAGW